eukprot:1124627-Pelagomonas_calceolata.AAC.8
MSGRESWETHEHAEPAEVHELIHHGRNALVLYCMRAQCAEPISNGGPITIHWSSGRRWSTDSEVHDACMLNALGQHGPPGGRLTKGTVHFSLSRWQSILPDRCTPT